MTTHQQSPTTPGASPTIWQRLVAAWQQPGARSLPTDSDFRKEIPIATAFNAYFPAAIVACAAWSKVANNKHNPGEPVHWARGKSNDHEDCLERHGLDLADARRAQDPAAELEEATCRFWRAGADLQLLCERLGAPLAPAARLPAPPTPRRWWVVMVQNLNEHGRPEGEPYRSQTLCSKYDNEEQAKAEIATITPSRWWRCYAAEVQS